MLILVIVLIITLLIGLFLFWPALIFSLIDIVLMVLFGIGVI